MNLTIEQIFLFFYNKNMFVIILGIAFIAFAVFACLPGGLDWGKEVISFLKGAAPSLAVLVGIISILVGIADARDRQEAKKEEREAMKAEQEAAKESKKD